MALEFKQDLLTHIPEIDRQHRELFRRLDALLTAGERGQGPEEMKSVIKFLENYVVEHFGAEERYMERFAYTNRVAHKAQHDIFVRTVLRLKERYLHAGADRDLIAETNELLVDYFIKHVRYADKALALFLQHKLAGAQVVV